MRIITLNVNGIRSARQKGFFPWLEKQNADVVCLQEIRIQKSQIDNRFYPQKYHSYYHPAKRKGYSGVAIFSRQKPDAVCQSPWSDINDEGRFLQIDLGRLSIISIYIPSGSAREDRQKFKMDFIENRLMPYLKKCQSDARDYIFCGDWNIAHKKIDLKNWRANQTHSGFLPEERRWMDALFNEAGFVDAFRVVNQSAHQYTWWSNRGRAWENNTGWRIDYQVLGRGLKHRVRSAKIYKDERFSDHAPLTMDYDL